MDGVYFMENPMNKWDDLGVFPYLWFNTHIFLHFLGGFDVFFFWGGMCGMCSKGLRHSLVYTAG